MVQQSENTTDSAVGTKSPDSAKRKSTRKRTKKKTTTAASAGAGTPTGTGTSPSTGASAGTGTTRKTTRKKRVTRRPPAAAAEKVAAADGAPPDNAADASSAGVARPGERDSAKDTSTAPVSTEGAAETAGKKPGSRTLKRPKARKKTVSLGDDEVGSTVGPKVARKKTTRTRTRPATAGSGITAPSGDAASSSTPPQRERFGAGIVVGREAGSNATETAGRQMDAVTPQASAAVTESKVVAEASQSNASTQTGDASVPSKPKANTRRRRSGQARRRKTTPAQESPVAEKPVAEAPVAEKPIAETPVAETPVAKEGVAKEGVAKEVKESEAPSPQPTAPEARAETAEEAAARIVLKRRPVRRSRRSRSRGKSDDKQANRTESTDPTESETHGGDANKAAEAPRVDAPAPAPTLAASATGASEATVAKTESRTGSSSRGRRRRRGQRGTATKETAPIVEAQEEDEETSEDEPQIASDITIITDDTKNDGIAKQGREMIINSTAGAECRIAILNDGRLEEIYIERQSAASHVGNIYKGRITNVESSIQAAFVDFGLTKNGFLHISDVLPKYFPNQADATENVGKKVPRRDRPPIQKCFRRGDEVIVQVAKEGVGTKGPTLTTYLSIPGRFVVMMPGMSKLGVSRRIEDDADRRAMRDLLGQLTMPDGMGFILRTAGLNRNKRELQSDLNYLNRLWKTVQKRIDSQPAPCELYQESDLVIRTIRDVYSSDFKRIVVDDHAVACKAKDFLRIAMPRTQNDVVAYQRHEPIFHRYGIEQEIHRIYSRHVPLPSGGSIVIDSTEAMVAIDVNSGKYRDQNDAEETAYRINVEAAEEIARQLRLRDLGGLVVCDFIDMRLDRHKRAVEKALRDALKSHKERARILRMSKFGLIEMTRQRQGPSIKRSVFVDCRHCAGSGLVKTPESMSLEVLRIVQLLAHRKDVAQVVVTVAPDVCALVLNEQRSFLHHLETNSRKSISILPEPGFTNDEVSYKCVDTRGMPLRIDV